VEAWEVEEAEALGVEEAVEATEAEAEAEAVQR